MRSCRIVTFAAYGCLSIFHAIELSPETIARVAWTYYDEQEIREGYISIFRLFLKKTETLCRHENEFEDKLAFCNFELPRDYIAGRNARYDAVLEDTEKFCRTREGFRLFLLYFVRKGWKRVAAASLPGRFFQSLSSCFGLRIFLWQRHLHRSHYLAYWRDSVFVPQTTGNQFFRTCHVLSFLASDEVRKLEMQEQLI